MIRSKRRLPSLLAVAAGLLVVAGCASGLPSVTPEQIPGLESRLASDGDDPDTQALLGVAYYRADRFDEAEATLEAAIEDGADAGSVYLFLGLANEGQEDWAGARAAYAQYLDAGRYGPLRSDIEARMAFIVRQQLRIQAQQTLEQEAQLADADPAPRSVAVFPFQVVSDDPNLEPLGVALGDMMITDLALAGELTVLERSQIQALLDEMALTEAGYTEAATGARAGRLLQAEHVVQGAVTTVGPERLQLATDVRNTVQQATTGETTGEEELAALFDLEKETVFQVLDVLGVELTPAEREAINENRTENILAFLAYGRGLQAMDRGDFQEAVAQFQASVQLDPSFGQAQDRAQESGQIQSGSEVDANQIEQQVAGEAGGGVAPSEGADQPSVASGNTTTNVLEQTASQTNPSRGQNITNQGSIENGTDRQTEERNPTQEAQNSDQIADTPTGTINIVIQRPGAGE